MQSQIRLRLTGDESGSGVCALMEDSNRIRYRISLEGPASQNLEVVLQGRSPYMDVFQTVAQLERFSGNWQQEGDIPSLPCPLGWLWVLRDGTPWLHTAFPGVGTPLEAARRQLVPQKRPAESFHPAVTAAKEPSAPSPGPEGMLVCPAGLRFAAADAGGYTAVEKRNGASYRWMFHPGNGEDAPFDPRACFCGADRGGYWILREKVTGL
jgi:hypothetical protein